MKRTSACLQCGTVYARGNTPECTLDENGREHSWCSTKCADEWTAADPKRSEGWVKLGVDPDADLRAFAAVGLHLGADSATGPAIQSSHVYPVDGREHEMSASCWCRPVPDRRDPRVLIHGYGST